MDGRWKRDRYENGRDHHTYGRACGFPVRNARCETSVIRHGTHALSQSPGVWAGQRRRGLSVHFLRSWHGELAPGSAGADTCQSLAWQVFPVGASAMPGTARAAFLVRLRPLHGRLPVPHIRQPRPLRRLPAWPAGPLPSRMLKSAAVMPAGRLACPAGHTGAYRAPVPCTPWSSHRAGGGSPAWHARRHGPTSVGAMIFPWPPGVVLPSFFVLSPYP